MTDFQHFNIFKINELISFHNDPEEDKTVTEDK